MAPSPMGRSRGVTEKPVNFKNTWIKIIKYCKAYLPTIILSLVAVVIATVLQIVGPDKLKDMTNEISNGVPEIIAGAPVLNGAINLDVVVNIAISLVIIYSLSLVFNFIQNYVMASVTQKISKQMRTDFSEKINKLPLNYFDKTSHGEVLSRITNDVDTIGQTLNQSVPNLVSSVVLLFGSVFMMFYTNWILALVAISSSIIGFILMIVIMSKSQKQFTAQQVGLGEINAHVEEVYTNHNVVRIYNGSKTEIRKFEKINKNLYNSAWKSQFFSGLMMPLMGFIGNFGYVSVCVVGAVLVLGNGLSFGVIIAFMLYIRLFTQPLSQIAQALNGLQRTAAAGERVFEFLDEVEIIDESNKVAQLSNVKGKVDFEHVNFGYLPGKTIIHDFSAKIKAGQKVAIVGPTGAGKTTMINLLMRFYELNSGNIKLDDIDISQITRENVHEQFCMVLQDTWLFEGTIFENIIYSKKDTTREQVIAACKEVDLHHFIMTLPNGYDTILNDKASISEGQKQLITIVRAMIKNAPLLILDEATSNVDTRTEIQIQKAMDELMKGRTSFVIAHRLSTIKNADLILVMKNGDIIESGMHSELLELNGFYAELYNSQFETY